MELNGCSKKDAQKELDRIAEENRRVSGSDVDLFGAESGEDDGGKKSTIASPRPMKKMKLRVRIYESIRSIPAFLSPIRPVC